MRELASRAHEERCNKFMTILRILHFSRELLAVCVCVQSEDAWHVLRRDRMRVRYYYLILFALIT